MMRWLGEIIYRACWRFTWKWNAGARHGAIRSNGALSFANRTPGGSASQVILLNEASLDVNTSLDGST